MKYELIIIGGGPAGIAAALSAKREGVEKILIIERDRELGGILQQCIHNGFGLHKFSEELTGPEYAERYINELKKIEIDIFLDAMGIDLDAKKTVTVLSGERGYLQIEGDAIILAMGCRERTRGAIMTPGERPAGIFTAGTAQRLLNIEGYMVGKEVVILGSGDIGLIMARRMSLEGANVKAVVEIQNYSGGLKRNIVQCLEDFNIPLYLSHTVNEIIGRERVREVIVSEVDENRLAIPGTEKKFLCDTVLLSVGLIPENELSKLAGIEMDHKTQGAIVDEKCQTSVEGIFACGNVLHVHDIVDFVSEEGEKAGKAAAEYLRNLNSEKFSRSYVSIKRGKGISYTVPQKIDMGTVCSDITIYMRTDNIYRDVTLKVGEEFAVKKNFLTPGEMIKIKLPYSKLKNLNGEITVYLQENIK